MRIVLTLALLALSGVAFVLVLYLPDDSDHAAATNREIIAAFADPPGQGILDTMRFDTTMGLKGKPADLQDYVQFDRGLFMSRECTDRCNYPPSAYFARETETGISFIVEAFCPTKNTTMVWRGAVEGNSVVGTVTWTTARFYWTRTQVLKFQGTRSVLAADLGLD